MDFSKVLKGIVEGAKAEGLELVEEQAKKLIGVIFAEIEKEAATSESDLVKVGAASLLPVLKTGLLGLVDKIDGTVG
jgi:hypothetical protein